MGEAQAVGVVLLGAAIANVTRAVQHASAGASGEESELVTHRSAFPIDMSAPGQSVECPHVIPDGEPPEHPVPLPGEQHAAAVGIKFDSADGAPTKEEPSQDASACSGE